MYTLGIASIFMWTGGAETEGAPAVWCEAVPTSHDYLPGG